MRKTAVLTVFLGVCLAVTGQNNWSSPALDLPIDARSGGLGFKIAADLNHNGYATSYNPAEADSLDSGVIHLNYLNYIAGAQIGAVKCNC